MISLQGLNTGPIDKLIKKATKFANLEDLRMVEPLLDDLAKTIVEDNRAGVLAGLDKDGQPAPTLKYRNGYGTPTGFRGQRRFGTTTGTFKGKTPLRGLLHRLGFTSKLPHNNLTTREYKKLNGPRLAPRREESRSIANLAIRKYRFEGGTWIIEAYWVDVLTPKGKPLLPIHFKGLGRCPKYDLRGVRPIGMVRARNLTKRYFQLLLKQAQP